MFVFFGMLSFIPYICWSHFKYVEHLIRRILFLFMTLTKMLLVAGSSAQWLAVSMQFLFSYHFLVQK